MIDAKRGAHLRKVSERLLNISRSLVPSWLLFYCSIKQNPPYPRNPLLRVTEPHSQIHEMLQMSSPTFPAFEDHPLPSWPTRSCLPPAGHCWARGGGGGSTPQQRPFQWLVQLDKAAAHSGGGDQAGGTAGRKQGENTGVHSAQSTFVKTLRSEPVDSLMQIFPLGV